MAIFRVCVKAKPSPQHREFREWEMARIVVLVKADDVDAARATAQTALTAHGGRSWPPNGSTCSSRIAYRNKEANSSNFTTQPASAAAR